MTLYNSCNKQDVKLESKIILMNPYGHLPGEIYGYLVQTKITLSVISLILTIWLIYCCYYHTELHPLHYHITVFTNFNLEYFYIITNTTIAFNCFVISIQQ